MASARAIKVPSLDETLHQIGKFSHLTSAVPCKNSINDDDDDDDDGDDELQQVQQLTDPAIAFSDIVLLSVMPSTVFAICFFKQPSDCM